MLSLIVAGSRGYTNQKEEFLILDYLLKGRKKHEITLIEGGARGADLTAAYYASLNGIPYKEINADWDTYGKKAGYIRNVEMHEELRKLGGERVCLCFWDGESPGTKSNFDLALNYGEKLIIWNYKTRKFSTI